MSCWRHRVDLIVSGSTVEIGLIHTKVDYKGNLIDFHIPGGLLK